MPDLIGQSLGRYHILEQLGEGGMAVVYKAYDTRLDRDVAVKIIRKGAFPPDHIEHILKRFEREARALARLSHPNIVKVHDFGEHEGSPYLVMEYLQSGTLKQKMGKPIPWLEAVRILLPIAKALAYAHKQDIIHRDVKPSNILITDEGEPLLSDFGVAKILDAEETMELTGTGVGVGTPEYMAPEQVTSKLVDARVDIYALGVVLFEMVTGRKPFIADTPMAVMIMHSRDPLPRPKSLAPNLPQEVENILFKAMAKDPKDRFQEMGEFAKALEGSSGSKTTDKKFSPPKTNDKTTRKTNAKFRLPVIPRQKLITLGIIAIGVGLAAVLLPLMKSLPATVFPAATTSFTPKPDFTSTPSHTPTLTFTPTANATNTPLASSTPTLGIGSTWVRPLDGMEMVFIPQGEFTMGSDAGEEDEKPAHQIYLDAYWIDRTEVTNAMYAKCVADGNCKNSATSERSSKYNEYPATYIKWEDAQSYCSWAQARLPSEAEWEKAARGTDARNYPWGNEKDLTMFYEYDEIGQTKKVGSYPLGSSPYGVLDMAGGVSEWVNDWYDADYYQNSPASNPLGPNSGEYHVLRGGLYYTDTVLGMIWHIGGVTHSSDREISSSIDYYFAHNVSTTDSIGFRCAKSH